MRICLLGDVYKLSLRIRSLDKLYDVFLSINEEIMLESIIFWLHIIS